MTDDRMSGNRLTDSRLTEDTEQVGGMTGDSVTGDKAQASEIVLSTDPDEPSDATPDSVGDNETPTEQDAKFQQFTTLSGFEEPDNEDG